MTSLTFSESLKFCPNPESELEANLRFGGIPWLLIIPVVLGVVLAILIQAVSLYSEWSEAKDPVPRDPEGWEDAENAW